MVTIFRAFLHFSGLRGSFASVRGSQWFADVVVSAIHLPCKRFVFVMGRGVIDGLNGDPK